MNKDQEIRQAIRRGLEKLGVDKVMKAVPALEDFGLDSYCGCFMGRAFGWEGKSMRYLEIQEDEKAFDFHVYAYNEVVQDRDLLAISKAHLYSDMRLKEEVMIFLAENGKAIEFNPQDNNKNVCLNSA